MNQRIRKLLSEVGDYEEYDNDSGENFWGNKGAGVLAYCPETQRFLLDHRSEFVNEPNTYNLYGGKVDEGNDEDIQDAVIREFHEETGYVGSLHLYPLYVFRTKGFEYHNFLGIIDFEFNPHNSWESQGHEWVTWDELINHEKKHFGLESVLNHDRSKILDIVSRQ